MPTYEFLCRACGATFEVIASIAEHERMKARPADVKCSRCGAAEAIPQLSDVQVQTRKKSA